MMTSNLRTYLDKKRRNGEKMLSIYLTTGFPTPEATLPLLNAIVDAGADLVELGIPFSDPLADGPTIQNAAQVALKNGTTLAKSLKMLADFTAAQSVPAILMGYSNPFMHYGWAKLMDDAKAAGAGGFIIPDLPPEESERICEMARKRDLDIIFLVAPNTPKSRIELVNSQSGGFVYAVSLTGVTGARDTLPPETRAFLERLRSQIVHPVLVGFGISNAETARAIAPYCDGVIVGSAVIRAIADAKNIDSAVANVRKLVGEIKSALA